MDKGLPGVLIARPRSGEGYVAWTGQLPLEDGWEGSEVRFAGQPSAELRATESQNGGVHVTGKVSATFQIRCRRCLVRQSSELEAAIDIRFEPDINPWDESLGLYALDERLDGLDLLPALKEELLLELPAYPLCRPECKGLCAICGMDLNVDACDCRTDTTDPRWEALRDVMETDAVDDDENQEG